MNQAILEQAEKARETLQRLKDEGRIWEFALPWDPMLGPQKVVVVKGNNRHIVAEVSGEGEIATAKLLNEWFPS